MKRLMLIALTGVLCTAAPTTGHMQQTMKPDPKPCESIKGKTYLGWNSGKFDDNPDAVNSHRIIFDANGKGTTREFFVLNATTTTAEQLKRTVTCSVFPNDGSSLAGKSFLDFGGGAKLFITSYYYGSKVWAEAATPGRPTKGWMLQLPPNSPPGSNIVK